MCTMDGRFQVPKKKKYNNYEDWVLLSIVPMCRWKSVSKLTWIMRVLYTQHHSFIVWLCAIIYSQQLILYEMVCLTSIICNTKIETYDGKILREKKIKLFNLNETDPNYQVLNSLILMICLWGDEFN